MRYDVERVALTIGYGLSGVVPVESVLLIAPRLDLKGTTIYTLTLVRELRLRGYKVGVLAAGGIFADELRKEKVPFLQADISGFFPRDLLYLHRIRAQIKEYGPKLIHVVHDSLAAIGSRIAAGVEIPYLLTIHTPVKSRILVDQRYLKKAIATSQPVRQSAVNAGGLPRGKVSVIEHGVATSVQPLRRKENGLVPVVGTVSNLDRDHGVKYFIRAAQELIGRGVEATYLIVGSGPYEKKIRQMIRKLSLEKEITLASAMPSYRKLVSPIDIFVSPALTEGFNVFILQAMSFGLPVVASAAGGVFSLITDEQNGLIVPKRDVSLFADKIQAYLVDKQYADKIGRTGFEFVQKQFPLHRMLENTLDAYSGESSDELETTAL